jgi:hypothetical protein
MVWASSRAFRRRTHSPSRQVVPAVTPTPIRDTPAEDEPMQVSVRVEVSAGAAIAGADRTVVVDGLVELKVMFCEPALLEPLDDEPDDDEPPVPPVPPVPPEPPEPPVATLLLLPEFCSEPPVELVLLLTLFDELPELLSLLDELELPVVLPLFEVLPVFDVLPTDELPVVLPVLVVLPWVLPLDVEDALLLAEELVLVLTLLVLPLVLAFDELPEFPTEPP